MDSRSPNGGPDQLSPSPKPAPTASKSPALGKQKASLTAQKPPLRNAKVSASLTVRKGAPKLGISNRSEEEEEDEAALVERQIRKAIPSTDIEDPDYAEAPRPTPGQLVPRRLAEN